MNRFEAWLKSKRWTPFPFQEQAWAAYRAGKSGLINAPTGMGKTLAAWGGVLSELGGEVEKKTRSRPLPGGEGKRTAPPLTVLWLTPLRALAKDTSENLRTPVKEMGLNWTVGLRTGDTSSSVRAKQRERMPTCLVTTPESLSVLLSYANHAEVFRHLRCVVVDEWHELMSTKRGVQVELGLARLRRIVRDAGGTLRTWGLSATLGNLEQAMRVLLGAGAPQGELVIGRDDKKIEIVTILPPDMERFPWAGHLGTRVLPQVLEKLARPGSSTLLFTNTRSQAEIWFRSIMKAKPEWLGEVAIHHGSLDRKIREKVEDLIREGKLRCVVCTSSLDLGVDFSPVDQVIQVGSPKGIGRLLQRAGRSGHQPGGVSRIVCVPTHAFELVEFAAAREAAEARKIESRLPVERPLDVLVQHLVTVALGGGFVERDLLGEVRSTHAFRGLTDDEWSWCLDFVTRGGPALRTYTQFAKVVEHEGRFTVPSIPIGRMHRMAIGTITSDSAMQVKLMRGTMLGTIEEGFIARMKPGDRFVFAGRTLELVMVRQMTAYVNKAPKGSGMVPKWMGARFPMSTQMADAVRRKVEEYVEGDDSSLPTAPGSAGGAGGPGGANENTPPSAKRFRERRSTVSSKRSHDVFRPTAPMENPPAEPGAEGREDPSFVNNSPEMARVAPVLDIQRRWSVLPRANELLIEHTKTHEGFNLCVFPFEGRLVHEGLATLIAYRLSREAPRSIVISVNDYGFELLSPQSLELDEPAWRRLLSLDNLLEDLLGCLNTSQMARRQFREIARVAGLVFPGFPGGRGPGGGQKSAKHLQASSELFFDVLVEFDPGNLLLDQARREVLERELEMVRLRTTLERMQTLHIVLRETPFLTPLAFPLWAEFIRGQVTSEKWTDRVERMALRLEAEASKQPVHGRTNRAKTRVHG